jgi:hypothetical protein
VTNAEKFVAHMNARLVSLQYGPSVPHFLELGHISNAFLGGGLVIREDDKIIFKSDDSYAVRRLDGLWVAQ